MKRAFRVVVSALFLAGAFSPAQAETVLMLVRHAEKVDESRETDLSDAGRARARALAAMLKDAGIEAIYSTDYLRTRETAKPTAEVTSKPIEVYDGDKLEVFAKDLRTRGLRALVVGHSDTTPELVKLLGGEPGSPIASNEYDRMYILTLSPDGKVSTVLLRFPSGVEK
jgi:broad specificity phosphatase PhoE